MTPAGPRTVAEYVAACPPDARAAFMELWAALRAAAPEAAETIKYGLPTLVLEGNLVHAGVFKEHLGFYPAPSGLEAFASDWAPWKPSKGAVRFPLEAPLPLELVRRVVAFRVAENLERAAAKRAAEARPKTPGRRG